MNMPTAIGALVVVTVITSFCADYLVGAIDEFAQDYKIPKAFIGLILLPIGALSSLVSSFPPLTGFPYSPSFPSSALLTPRLPFVSSYSFPATVCFKRPPRS
jgi:hypothetical protein